MELEFHYLSKDEALYINKLVGYELEKEGNSVIRSTEKTIYGIYIQFGHPDPDYNLETTYLIVYNNHIIRLKYRLSKGGGVNFSEIFVPMELKGQRDRVIEIIKEIQTLKATGRGGDPSETVVEYPAGFHMAYYDKAKIKMDIFCGVNLSV